MKKNGFTLIEVLLVVTIFAMIMTIVAPAIMKAVGRNYEQKYIALEKVLKTNLELYNEDRNEDIWGFDMSTAPTCAQVDLTNLSEVNPDIQMDDCEIGEMWIKRDEITNNYEYNIQIKCDKQTDGSYTYTTEDYNVKHATCLDLNE